mmetsp:Transcript_23319/g.36625  ORF Transcript_23319/g.36625 Transcript_23319/m.36625 type:complete len:277 (-) Transcript_23319:126-956(-)
MNSLLSTFSLTTSSLRTSGPLVLLPPLLRRRSPPRSTWAEPATRLPSTPWTDLPSSTPTSLSEPSSESGLEPGSLVLRELSRRLPDSVFTVPVPPSPSPLTASRVPTSSSSSTTCLPVMASGFSLRASTLSARESFSLLETSVPPSITRVTLIFSSTGTTTSTSSATLVVWFLTSTRSWLRVREYSLTLLPRTPRPSSVFSTRLTPPDTSLRRPAEGRLMASSLCSTLWFRQPRTAPRLPTVPPVRSPASSNLLEGGSSKFLSSVESQLFLHAPCA